MAFLKVCQTFSYESFNGGHKAAYVCACAYMCVPTHLKAYYLHMFYGINPDVYWAKRKGIFKIRHMLSRENNSPGTRKVNAKHKHTRERHKWHSSLRRDWEQIWDPQEFSMHSKPDDEGWTLTNFLTSRESCGDLWTAYLSFWLLFWPLWRRSGTSRIYLN